MKKYFLEYLNIETKSTNIETEVIGSKWERLDLREWDNYDDAYVARCETQKVINDKYIRVSSK